MADVACVRTIRDHIRKDRIPPTGRRVVPRDKWKVWSWDYSRYLIDDVIGHAYSNGNHNDRLLGCRMPNGAKEISFKLHQQLSKVISTSPLTSWAEVDQVDKGNWSVIDF